MSILSARCIVILDGKMTKRVDLQGVLGIR